MPITKIYNSSLGQWLKTDANNSATLGGYAANINAVANTVVVRNNNGDISANQYVGFGTSNGSIKNTSGAFELRNGADTNYADLTVNNLTVKGTATITESTTISTGDSKIVLNGLVSDTASPTLNGSLQVNRGNQTDASLLWDEGSDIWKAGLLGSEKTIVLTDDARLTPKKLYANDRTDANYWIESYWISGQGWKLKSNNSSSDNQTGINNVIVDRAYIADSVSWTNVQSRPISLSAFTNDVAVNRAGDTMTGTLNSPGIDLTGNLTINNGKGIQLEAKNGKAFISFWDSTYDTWQEYMANVGAGNAVNGTTANSFGSVTSFARRSIVENSAGYGWIWESTLDRTKNGGTSSSPSPMMSLDSANGNLTVRGSLVSKSNTLDNGSGAMTVHGVLTNTVATGTAPLSIASSTLVTNLNVDLLDGHHSTDFAPFKSLTATTAATAGWYRIATSVVNIGSNSGMIKVDFSGTGVIGRVLFVASCQNGVTTATKINQLGFTTSSASLGITQARIVYNTTPSANYAYVEIYNPTALALTFSVDLIDTTGWSLVTPNTAGSIPTGYTTATVTFDVGIVSMDDITSYGRLVSAVGTGTAPLVVTSTTKVTNLQADTVDGYHLNQDVQTTASPTHVSLTLTSNEKIAGKLSVGTTTETNAQVQITAPSLNINPTAAYIGSNLLLQGTSNSRTVGVGPSLTFAMPANTDGSNLWEQARILATPDNTNTSDASGRLYLQTRYSNSGWSWRNNMTLTSNGSVSTTNNILDDGSGNMQATAINSSYYVSGAAFSDNLNGSPWYGLGRSSVTLNGATGTAVQLAGYFGLMMYTGSHSLVIPALSTDQLLYDGNKVWHAGNGGVASGLDADKVDGLHADYASNPYSVVARDSNANIAVNSLLVNANAQVNNALYFKSDTDNSDAIYFYKNDVSSNISSLDLTIGDDGTGNWLPYPSTANIDYFAIRSSNKGIHHLFGCDGTYQAATSVSTPLLYTAKVILSGDITTDGNLQRFILNNMGFYVHPDEYGAYDWTNNKHSIRYSRSSATLGLMEDGGIVQTRYNVLDYGNGKMWVGVDTNYGTVPAYTLTLGDSDTGFNWTGDGHFDICADSTVVGKVSAGGVSIPSLVPPGAVMYFAFNSVPNGWMKCNGAAVSRSTYANLFAAIGTTYGAGDGSSTFNLPDLRGEFVRTWDDGRGVDNGRAFGSWQGQNIQQHSHGLYGGLGASGSGWNWVGEGSTYIKDTNLAGGNETRPRNIALMACIKY